MRRGVGSLKPKNQELVEARCSSLKQPRDGIGSFLDGMFILFPVGRKVSVSLIRCVPRCEIHAHNPNTNRTASPSLEFLGLTDQIADYAIDLLDHCLSQYFGFGPDLDVCDRPTRDRESLVCDRLRYGHSLPECPVSSSS